MVYRPRTIFLLYSNCIAVPVCICIVRARVALQINTQPSRLQQLSSLPPWCGCAELHHRDCDKLLLQPCAKESSATTQDTETM